VCVCSCVRVQVCGQVQAAFDAIASVAQDQKAFAQGAAAHKRYKTILLQMRKVLLQQAFLPLFERMVAWLTPSPTQQRRATRTCASTCSPSHSRE
jgi:hypothetical protein